MAVSAKLGGYFFWVSLLDERYYLGPILGPLIVGNSQIHTPPSSAMVTPLRPMYVLCSYMQPLGKSAAT